MFIFLLLSLPFPFSYFTIALAGKYPYYKSMSPNIQSTQSIPHPNYLLVKCLLSFFVILIHAVDHFHHAQYHLIETSSLRELLFDFTIN